MTDSSEIDPICSVALGWTPTPSTYSGGGAGVHTGLPAPFDHSGSASPRNRDARTLLPRPFDPRQQRPAPSSAASPADRLLSTLDKVRQVGPGEWIACCPAHDDRSPSLAVRELEDGRLLIHDFGGCATGEVVAAVGMTLSDLFPTGGRRRAHHREGLDRPLRLQDVARALSHELLLAQILLVDLADGREVDGERARSAAYQIGTFTQELARAR